MDCSPNKSLPEIDVVAGIIWRGRHFLAVKRPEGKPQAGFWEFPGGKLEPGESFEQALARELDEELGVTPTTWAYWMEKRHDYGHIKVRLRFYHVHQHAGRAVSREGHELKWVDAKGACEIPFLEADTEIVKALCTAPEHQGD